MSTFKRYTNWKNIETNLDTCVDKFDSLRFDTILGLARGGMIPATLLSYKLNCHNLQQLGVRTRDVEAIQYYGSPLLTGRVLVVDDINDSGLTFSSVDNYIRYHFDHNEIDEVTYCSLYRRYNTKFKTDITGEVVNDDDWLVFPWD
jgi:hypoxanthine phosphoribosyltransferase